MRKLLSLTCLALLSVALFASDTFEGTIKLNYEVSKSGPAKKSHILLTVRGNETVIQFPEDANTRIILNKGNKSLMVLMNSNGNKTAFKADYTDVAKVGLVKSMLGADQAAALSFDGEIKPTTESATVGGYKSLKYDVKGEGYDGDVWLSEAVPYSLSEILSLLEINNEAFANGMLMKANGKSSESGYKLKLNTEIEANPVSIELFKTTGYQIQDMTFMLRSALKSQSPEEVRKFIKGFISK